MRRALAALLTGTAIGATAAGGTALLLYTGQGFIRAAGLLVSSSIMALAAGIWAGAPESGTSSRVRWVMVVLTMLAGGMFVDVWSGSESLRALAAGGALAVLLVLAMPAYAAGSLLASLSRRGAGRRGAPAGGAAAGALAGAAIGVLVATGMLIQTLQPSGIYYSAAALLAFAALLHRGADAAPARTGGIDMTDHVTLITGVGSRGQLGYAVARSFLDAGALVTITARSPDVESVAAELRANGHVFGQHADLLDDDDVERLVAGVRDRHGRLDSLINIAGGLTVIGRIEETTPEQWRRESERNAETVLRMCRASLPLLRAARGAIVNFTSPVAHRAPARLAAYSAAKAAVIAITDALAREERLHGVRANAVAPGVMDTEQNRRDPGDEGAAALVSRDDVAAVVLFLAGPASRGVNGQTVHVPGPTLT